MSVLGPRSSVLGLRPRLRPLRTEDRGPRTEMASLCSDYDDVEWRMQRQEALHGGTALEKERSDAESAGDGEEGLRHVFTFLHDRGALLAHDRVDVRLHDRLVLGRHGAVGEGVDHRDHETRLGVL